MKLDYEHIIAPALINQINSINNSYVNNIKDQISRFKQEIDSDQFKYLDFLHNTSPNPHHVSRWPLMVFLFSAFVCLMCSTLFHLFYPMSSSNFFIIKKNLIRYSVDSIMQASVSWLLEVHSHHCIMECTVTWK